jgi:hypothetical protein
VLRFRPRTAQSDQPGDLVRNRQPCILAARSVAASCGPQIIRGASIRQPSHDPPDPAGTTAGTARHHRWDLGYS